VCCALWARRGAWSDSLPSAVRYARRDLTLLEVALGASAREVSARSHLHQPARGSGHLDADRLRDVPRSLGLSRSLSERLSESAEGGAC